jgi:hypothetical protein
MTSRRELTQHIAPRRTMSGYKNFAIVGADATKSFVVHQFLKNKATGTVHEVVVLTRQVRLCGRNLGHTPVSHAY